jgi:anti-sigma B factor antagonist
MTSIVTIPSPSPGRLGLGLGLGLGFVEKEQAMEIEHRVEDGMLLVTLIERRLDARSAPVFREKLADFVHAGHHRIALDISQVEFIDSSGLGAIVSLLKRVAGQGDVVICGARDTVLSMFKLTRLDKVFRIVGGPADALVALKQ